MSKTIHRIITLLRSLNLSARQFDISIGASNGYTLRMQKNDASVGSDILERIKDVYPKVNLVWLLTGEGEMLLEEKPKKKPRTDAEIEAYIETKLKEKWETEKQALLEELKNEIKNVRDD
ncbi:hypothetical protein [Bizionia sp.]|uniref:hypothetical protein n=1 Tax=Bizionia sp. TaxID=1954480 RepID=UPI003A8D0471